MYDDYSYLIHSAKGSTWSKSDHKYISKEKKNGKWRYIYKMAQKAADDATRDEIARRAKENEEANRVYGHQYYDEQNRREEMGKEFGWFEKSDDAYVNDPKLRNELAVKLMKYHGLDKPKYVGTQKQQDEFKRKGYFK